MGVFSPKFRRAGGSPQSPSLAGAWNTFGARTSQRRQAGRGRRLLLELLEPRAMLSAVTPIDLATASASYPHLDPSLLNLVVPLTVTPGASQSSSAVQIGVSQHTMMFDSAGRVGVHVTATDVAQLLPSLEALGLQNVTTAPAQHFLEGYLPTSSLLAAENLSSAGLLGVLPMYRPMTASVGSFTDEADNILQSDRVRASSPSYTGAGVTVGVLSDSFNDLGGAAADVASGDLPAAGVKVVQDIASGGTDEGRAMCQAVHHVAPGAAIDFATADNGEASFAQNIRTLAASPNNCQIITDDVFYYDEPFFQDGIIAQAIDSVVTTNKAAYFSAAGNDANQAYESANVSFMNDTIAAISNSPASYYAYGPGVDKQDITIPAGYPVAFSLQWDQPYYTAKGVTTELDMYLLDHTTGALLASATTSSVATQTPNQILTYMNPSTTAAEQCDIVICKSQGPSVGRIKYVDYGDGANITFNNYATNSGTEGGHAASANAMAVAAVPFYDQRNPESFTSLGPVTILFDASGNRLSSAQVRAKPNIASVDGTTTTFFGDEMGNDGLYHFFGTSCAAPHAAAVAALLKQANPSFTPAQIYAQLESTADPNIGGTPGNTHLVGAGLIDAYRAIVGQTVPAAINTSDGFESGTLGQDWDVYDSGSARTWVTSLDTPKTGTYQLLMDSSIMLQPGYQYTGMSVLNEAILHVNALAATNVSLAFDEKEFTDSDDPMPASFSGNGNYDGVALSVDGTNWYRVVSLTGSVSINAYQHNTFNLNAIAAADRITLSADTQIKFQHYCANSSQSPASSLAFDNVQMSGSINLPPTVTGVSPSAGPVAGGTSVIITGTNLAGATAVDFGGVAASITNESATQITATSPPGTAGTVDITVITPGGTTPTSSADQFTYVAAPSVTSISPTSGPAIGGTSVTITGANLAGATAVDFGGVAAAITNDTATQITATSPAGTAYTVDVTVTTAGGTSATSSADQFTYLTPDMTVTKTHTGTFTQGDVGDSYAITATNSGTSSTTGAVSVVDALPAGLTATAMSGTGWTVNLATLTATRSDVLAPGASYPALTVTVNVAVTAPATVTNTATVSGGGEVNAANDTANDLTPIIRATDLTIATSHPGNFRQGDTGDAYTILVTNPGAIATNGQVSVVDTLPAGLTATAMTGTGWTVNLATLTATRSDALAGGASYPALTVTVNVAGNAPASVTNTVTVAGGGELNTANDTANDPTTIVPASDLTVAAAHTGNFRQGDAADSYTITVTNSGAGPTVGAVSVADTLPAGLAAVAMSGVGWSVNLSSLTATRSDVLGVGASYPVLYVTVSVAGDAPASVTNAATVSGGGELNATNDSASDSTTIVPASDMTIAATHAGNFRQGDSADAYTITVTNSGVGPTLGAVSVADTLPAGLTATAMSGTGWTVNLNTLTATRSDVLAAGASYPALTVTVSVAANAPALATNTATVSGGGELNATNDTASDPTTIAQVADLTVTNTNAEIFRQWDVGAAYTITVSNSGTGPTAGLVSMVDTLPDGLTPTAADSGTIDGWSVLTSGQTVTATRSDVLAPGASYPALSVTVDIAGDAPASVTNAATVAGGGEVVTTNDTANDVTTISPALPDLTITGQHVGNFTQEDVGDTYTITVGNSGAGSTVGPVSIADALPAGLTATAMSGAGWTVNLAALTATRSDVLAAGASYPLLSVTVNVAANAPASATNTATVSGGGETNTANDTANDPTTLNRLWTVSNVTGKDVKAGATSFSFVVTRAVASPQTINLNYATADGTAIAGQDYLPGSGSMIFSPGVLQQTIAVAVKGSKLYETDKAFFLNVIDPAGATGGGTGTIQSANLPPSVSIGNVSLKEGNSGTTNFNFVVSLSTASGSPATVVYATADGTATVGDNDYQAAGSTLTFAPGQTKQTVTVAVNGDTKYEANETFSVHLSNSVGVTVAKGKGTGTGTIINDDKPPVLAIGNATVAESVSGGTAVFTVTLSPASGLAATVKYATAAGTAKAGRDFTTTSGILTFAPGQTTETIAVPILSDPSLTNPETFLVKLSAPKQATLGKASTGTGTIQKQTSSLLDALAAAQASKSQAKSQLTGPAVDEAIRLMLTSGR